MPTFHQCDFYVLRYVPDLVKGEFVNIGVVLLGDDFSDVKMTRDWRRVRCMDAEADLELLAALEEELRSALRSSAVLDQVFLFQKLPDWASNALQLTPIQGVLTDSPEAELGRLVEMYCEAKRGGKRDLSGRQMIYNAMRESFTNAGVWDLMRQRIPVAQYTYKGDPLKLDCGYRPNGTVHLFHSVSLKTDVDAAKVLAFSYPQIREGIARLEHAKTTLTAVVEDGLNRGDEAVGFALETFEKTEIIVATVSDLPAIAEVARVELRV